MANPGAAKYANWLGVLRWSLAYNDGTRPSEWKPMSEDDQKFLQRVMDSMTVDEAARMEDIATVLLRSPADIVPPAAGAAADTAVANAASVEGAEEEDDDKPKLPPMPPSMHALLTQKLDMLEELTDIVDSIDNAKNLFIVGAFQPLLLTLYDPLALTVPPSYARTAPRLSAGCASDAASSETTSAGAGVSAAAPSAPELSVEERVLAERVRTGAAGALAAALQNNPKAQEWAASQGVVDVIAGTFQSVGRDHSATCAAGAVDAAGSNVAALQSQRVKLQAACVTALSCAVRDCPPASRALVTLTEGSDTECPLTHVLRPLVEWTPACTDADVRRLVRKTLFFLQQACLGAEGEAVKTLLAGGTDARAPFLTTLVAVLSMRSSADEGAAADWADARASALNVLLYMTQKTAPPAVVVDESEHRSGARAAKYQKVLQVGQAASPAPTAGSGAAVSAGAGSSAMALAVVPGESAKDVDTAARTLPAASSAVRMQRMLAAPCALLPALEAYAEQCASAAKAADAETVEGVEEEAAVARDVIDRLTKAKTIIDSITARGGSIV